MREEENPDPTSDDLLLDFLQFFPHLLQDLLQTDGKQPSGVSSLHWCLRSTAAQAKVCGSTPQLRDVLAVTLSDL